MGLFVGSTIGGLLPELFGASLLSWSGEIGSAVGGIAGIWLGYVIGKNNS